jgi:GT2 family glycosyltransferase
MPATHAPLVSVLLPSWNTKAYVEAFLGSSLCQDYELNAVEVVILDNGSRDGSAEVLGKWRDEHASRFRRVIVEAFDVNRGIAAAYNRAFELADLEAEVLVRAESDILWEPQVLTQLVSALLGDPRIAVVGARGILLREPSRVEHAARTVNWWTGVVRSADPPGVIDCDAVLGSTFAIRRSVVRKWPTLFPTDRFFADELGFCTRIKRKGYRVVFQPGATVLHRSGGSTRLLDSRRFAFVDTFERVLLHLELNPPRSRWCALSLMAGRALYRRHLVTLRAMLAAFAFAWLGRRPIPGNGDLGHLFACWVPGDAALEDILG